MKTHLSEDLQQAKCLEHSLGILHLCNPLACLHRPLTQSAVALYQKYEGHWWSCKEKKTNKCAINALQLYRHEGRALGTLWSIHYPNANPCRIVEQIQNLRKT